MSEYAPPFTLSAQAVSLIADIAALTERFTLRMEQPDALLLRRANKVNVPSAKSRWLDVTAKAGGCG